MFDGITPERVLAMSDQEQRWFDNIKKGFYESDRDYIDGTPEDSSVQELCAAIDTAKTLRRSLRGEDTSRAQNKARFIEFLRLELPDPRNRINLIDARSGQPKAYTLAELIYDIRCMIHENENLNASEGVNYHVLIQWKDFGAFGRIADGRIIVNGPKLWGRMREILSKFILGIDALASMGRGEGFSVTIRPPVGSVRPKQRS